MLDAGCDAVLIEDSDARLLELWKTEDAAEVGADCIDCCGYDGL